MTDFNFLQLFILLQFMLSLLSLDQRNFNVLSYPWVWQRTTLSQHPPVEAELASHTPRKINDL